MGLDNLPKRCSCGKHGYAAGVPEVGATHPKDVPCPLVTDGFPIGPFGTCCSLRGKIAARELEALGKTDLAERLYHDMTAEQAIAFGDRLRATAAVLRKMYGGADKEKPKGAGWNGAWDATTGSTQWQTYSTFEEAVRAIDEAARWYDQVGHLGFGVHAWY